jgi:hypothetical protein
MAHRSVVYRNLCYLQGDLCLPREILNPPHSASRMYWNGIGMDFLRRNARKRSSPLKPRPLTFATPDRKRRPVLRRIFPQAVSAHSGGEFLFRFDPQVILHTAQARSFLLALLQIDGPFPSSLL